MKVFLISSGIGPWPNDGWGAVENLVADFAWALQAEGAEVEIYHKSSFGPLLEQRVAEFSPDIVHCQYDDHIYEIIPLMQRFPSIQFVLTTHYAYLSQPYRLVQDAYMNRFLLASECAQKLNLTLAVLSPQIADTYADLGGVSRDHIWVFPNGTRTDQIECRSPVFPDRAICVGKIEPRKQQAKIQGCKAIDFVGPLVDTDFQAMNQYKGTWSRKDLYSHLTDYPCLVLLSQAEAHPLVIGEALAAGCAIVCSEIASANLPRDVPWIRILSSLDTLEKDIQEMCEIGCKYRQEIREWACKELDWRLRANEYLKKFTKPEQSRSLSFQTTSPLRIALVGPGIMPIPPPGWGAVEQLIWDYTQTLRKQGHFVEIINTPVKGEIIDRVQNGSFDIVHIHYDVFSDVTEHIKAKAILLTSHYPYIDQPEKWVRDGFNGTFQTMCTMAQKLNVWVFALCEKDAAVFRQMNGLQEKVRLLPNGVNVDAFEFRDSPHFGDRSVVLAKIEPRKRQHLTYWFSDVDYIGKGEFHHPNFRGELSHEMLYRILGDFGNLVLLSEGEASSLAIKEALACGLGCVLSKSAANEFPQHLPFLTVVPEEDLCKVEKLHEHIVRNRQVSRSMRSQIREWTRANWDWTVVVQAYAGNLKSILEKCC